MSKDLQKGDYVQTTFSHPLTPIHKFEIEEIKDIGGEPHGCGNKGSFPLRLLKKTRKTKN